MSKEGRPTGQKGVVAPAKNGRPQPRYLLTGRREVFERTDDPAQQKRNEDRKAYLKARGHEWAEHVPLPAESKQEIRRALENYPQTQSERFIQGLDKLSSDFCPWSKPLEPSLKERVRALEKVAQMAAALAQAISTDPECLFPADRREIDERLHRVTQKTLNGLESHLVFFRGQAMAKCSELNAKLPKKGPPAKTVKTKSRLHPLAESVARLWHECFGHVPAASWKVDESAGSPYIVALTACVQCWTDKHDGVRAELKRPAESAVKKLRQ